MFDVDKPELAQRFLRMFKCDSARLSKPGSTMFLIIGWKRHTKDDPGQWHKNGEPWDYEYMKEEVIACGKTEEELIASAKEYKRLCKLTMKQYLQEICRGSKQKPSRDLYNII